MSDNRGNTGVSPGEKEGVHSPQICRPVPVSLKPPFSMQIGRDKRSSGLGLPASHHWGSSISGRRMAGWGMASTGPSGIHPSPSTLVNWVHLSG